MKNRSYPLLLGGYPCGFYGTARLLLGEERVLTTFYDDPKLLRYLSDKDILPGKLVTAIEFSEFDSNLTIEVEGHSEPIVLGPRITALIHIERL